MTDRTPLTPQGEARRDAMLQDLIARQSRHRRARRLQRAASIATLMFITFATGILFLRAPRLPLAPRILAQKVPTPGIEYIETDHTLVSRWTVSASVDPAIVIHTRPLAVEYLTDDTLLATLDRIGRPAGLIRTPGRVTLTTGITDEQPLSGAENAPAPTPPS